MCDPILGGSAAALAGGTVLSGMGRNSATKAQYGAMNAEAGRQRGFRDAASGAWNKTLDGMEPGKEGQALADAKARRADAAKANVTDFSAVKKDGVGDAPKVITDAYARGDEAARGYGLDYGDRTGALEGYGERLFSRSVDIGRGRQDIDKYGNFSRGSQSVLPMEMEGAATKGSTLRSIGEIFSGLGNLGLMYGLTRAPGAAPPPGGSAVLGSAGTIPGIGRIR